MLYYLCHLENYWGPFRLFRYVTFRSILALIIALVFVLLVGPKIFAWLRKKNCRDVVRDASQIRELSAMHADKKNTTTMGGISIVGAVVLAVLLCAHYNCYCVGALLAGLALASIGVIDDWLKIRYRNSRGLNSCWKWLVQGLVAWLLLFFLLQRVESSWEIDKIYVPFLKDPLCCNVPFVLLFLFWFMVLSGTSNAINLTDGIDGLAVGCSITVVLTYSIFAYVTGHIVLAKYLHLTYLNGVEELTVLCFSILGACIGFLWYNAHPAEVFMGDTGSLALGAWIGCVALMCQQAFTLVIVGGVFVVEALSVILQVASFKMFKRRIFKMSPLHHHFELMQIPESKIIVRFWIVSLLCALGGILTLKLR